MRELRTPGRPNQGGGKMDPTFLIPADARARALALEDAEASATVMLSATARTIKEMHGQILQNPAVEQECLAEIKRLETRMEKQRARLQNVATLSATIKHFLASLPANVRLEPTPKVKVRPQKGESTPQAVERLRARIAELLAEREQVLRAELPVADKKRAAKAYVNALVQRAAPRISPRATTGHSMWSSLGAATRIRPICPRFSLG